MTRVARLIGFIALSLAVASPALAVEDAPPVAVDDHVETDGKTIHVHVLSNDSGDFDESTLSIVSPPSRGSAVVIASGSPKIKYTATGSEPGTDSFQYQVCGGGGCAAATVYVNIVPAATTTTSATSTTLATTTTTAEVTTTTEATTTTTAPTTETTLLDGPVEESPPPEASLPTPLEPTTTAAPIAALPPRLHPLGELALESHDMTVAAGTTIGEPRGIQFDQDISYLGRSGRDTLKLVAIPALMVSGIVGFLMVGLPQNAVGALLGFLVGFKRRKKETEDDAVAMTEPETETIDIT